MDERGKLLAENRVLNRFQKVAYNFTDNCESCITCGKQPACISVHSQQKKQ